MGSDEIMRVEPHEGMGAGIKGAQRVPCSFYHVRTLRGGTSATEEEPSPELEDVYVLHPDLRTRSL